MAYDGYASSSDEAYLKITPGYNPIDGYDFKIKVVGNIHNGGKEKLILRP